MSNNRNHNQSRSATLPQPWPQRGRTTVRHRGGRAEQRTVSGEFPLVAALCGVMLGAFTLRALLINRQSAFMDEKTQILIGRYLIEKHTVYADALDWSYGSYLWPLLAGAADMVGGLSLVRLLTALFGALMVLATALTTLNLAPRTASPSQRWTAALLAGLVMALFPTAIALGRFGTYDAFAGAAFMAGIALLVSVRHSGRRTALLGAAGAMFVAFLSKYVVAIYFPAICLYLMLSPLVQPPRNWRTALRNTTWFVVPLAAACALYFLAFSEDLLTLLSFSTSYTDLKSATPLREYVWQRPEVWALAGLAAYGWQRAGRPERLITVGGAGIIVAFHVYTRADFDWWKHSLYAIFFLAPLAGLALAPLAERLVGTGGRQESPRARWQILSLALAAGALAPTVGGIVTVAAQALALGSTFSRWKFAFSLVLLVATLLGLFLAPLVELHLEARSKRGAKPIAWRAIGLTLATVIATPLALAFTLAQSDRLVTFYPNLNPAVDAIRTHAAGTRTILVDDSAVRYYLYPQMRTEDVVDPFALDYRGRRYALLSGPEEIEGYRRAIMDRYFDAIVLDGGIGPFGARIKRDLGGLIAEHYDRVYSVADEHGKVVEIYRPREDVAPVARALPAGATLYSHETGFEGWGAQPENGELQAGLGVTISLERTWQGRPSLQFDVTPELSLFGVRQTGPVTRVRAWIYVVPTERAGSEVHLGMVGFDQNWQWHDNGFDSVVVIGRWTEVTWELAEPGLYNTIGFKLQPANVETIYVGRVEIER